MSSDTPYTSPHELQRHREHLLAQIEAGGGYRSPATEELRRQLDALVESAALEAEFDSRDHEEWRSYHEPLAQYGLVDLLAP